MKGSQMKILAGIKTVRPGKVIVPLFFAMAVPKEALANSFAKQLQDVPDRIGTGELALDSDWSLVGLLGLALVVGLLAAFYRRDKEQ